MVSQRYRRNTREHQKINKENQFIDFRLLTTKKEKPRFFLLCQKNKAALKARPS
ncbi:hypothetical protein HMPREF0201_04532 [Cedecea davisae DSM 4568]|uniref:Uncharacterized protein n=1 Tax=Cedecea davisae DSM 4568 TaxID=566551 RepID=S3JIA1_9ENTR|nr:hypothetical protein HMPREF0201_04532 [Cedecea davisae DSM 4568]